MSVYVDSSQNKFYRYKMCHMMADSLEELHAMATRLGLRRSWFQPRSSPHYDLCQSKRRQAIELGAVEVDRRQLVDIIKRLRTELATQGTCSMSGRMYYIGPKHPAAAEPVPPGVIRLRVRGSFKLNREPQYVDAWGWGVFHLNEARVDWADSCNAAYRQLHGDTPTPESDLRYEQMLRDRAERQLAEKKVKAAA